MILLLKNNFENVSICGNGSKIYVGGVSDSAYVYSYESDWSENLAKPNLGLPDKPDAFQIEYCQNKLYALCEHDNKLEAFVYNQNAWNSVGVLEPSFYATDIGFKVFNNKLYVYYSSINTSTNSTLVIKHFDGSNWQTDFKKAYDYIKNIDVSINSSGEIYFSSDSQDWDSWRGEVFKVTSTSLADELIPTSNDWLTFPSAIDFDNNGNPIVLYWKFISVNDPMQIHLAVLENNEWKDVAGNFSDHVSPADIESNNGLYLVYGDGTNLTNNSYPLQLKSVKLSK